MSFLYKTISNASFRVMSYKKDGNTRNLYLLAHFYKIRLRSFASVDSSSIFLTINLSKIYRIENFRSSVVHTSTEGTDGRPNISSCSTQFVEFKTQPRLLVVAKQAFCTNNNTKRRYCSFVHHNNPFRNYLNPADCDVLPFHFQL